MKTITHEDHLKSGTPSSQRLDTGPHRSREPEPVQFLTAKQAAAYLGCFNDRTLTRWAREGYLPAIPVGEGKRRCWRFRKADLKRWMLARRTGPISRDPEWAGATLEGSHRCSPQRSIE